MCVRILTLVAIGNLSPVSAAASDAKLLPGGHNLSNAEPALAFPPALPYIATHSTGGFSRALLKGPLR